MIKLQTYIVEDSPVILENLVATLEDLVGIEVVGTADSESAALAGWAERAEQDVGIDLIIVDIFLKTGSGLGLLAEAAARGLTGRRVVLTNYATSDIRRRCAALGADRVFDKSADLEELISYCEALSAERNAAPRLHD